MTVELGNATKKQLVEELANRDNERVILCPMDRSIEKAKEAQDALEEIYGSAKVAEGSP